MTWNDAYVAWIAGTASSLWYMTLALRSKSGEGAVVGLVTVVEYGALGVLVALSTAAVDYAAARYFRAMEGAKRHRAARWSVTHGILASIAFIVAMKITLWLLPFEWVGLYAGCWLGSGQGKTESKVVPSMKIIYDHVARVACPACHREVAVVRATDPETRDSMLVVSRHFTPPKTGFCQGSLTPHQFKEPR